MALLASGLNIFIFNIKTMLPKVVVSLHVAAEAI